VISRARSPGSFPSVPTGWQRAVSSSHEARLDRPSEFVERPVRLAAVAKNAGGGVILGVRPVAAARAGDDVVPEERIRRAALAERQTLDRAGLRRRTTDRRFDPRGDAFPHLARDRGKRGLRGDYPRPPMIRSPPRGIYRRSDRESACATTDMTRCYPFPSPKSRDRGIAPRRMRDSDRADPTPSLPRFLESCTPCGGSRPSP
jgi:hypothetical protein